MPDDAIIHLRVPASLKARWVRQSQRDGQKLSDWITQRMEQAAHTKVTATVVNERLQALESDPAYDYCHRLAILLECMTLDSHRSFDDACALLDEYYAARDKWAEAQGQPYVSGFGKD